MSRASASSGVAARRNRGGSSALRGRAFLIRSQMDHEEECLTLRRHGRNHTKYGRLFLRFSFRSNCRLAASAPRREVPIPDRSNDAACWNDAPDIVRVSPDVCLTAHERKLRQVEVCPCGYVSVQDVTAATRVNRPEGTPCLSSLPPKLDRSERNSARRLNERRCCCRAGGARFLPSWGL
jgi:hypothetical protein